MKVENQVCTLEQAKRLKELGIKQASFFAYWDDISGNPLLTSSHTDRKILGAYNIAMIDVYAAFTVAELGVMLPTHFELNEQFGCLCTWKKTQKEDKWLCEYQYDKVSCISNYTASEETEAAAKCDLLIHLLETGKVTAEECNKRLLSA